MNPIPEIRAALLARVPLDRAILVLLGCHIFFVSRNALANTAFGLALLIAAVRWAREGKPYEPHVGNVGNLPILLPCAAYALFSILSAAVSVLVSGAPAASLLEAKEVLVFLLVPLVLSTVRGSREVRLLFGVLVAMGLLLAAWGAIEYLLRRHGGGDSLGTRISGPLSHYMTYSGIVMIADLVLVTALVLAPASGTGWRSLRRWMFAGVALLTLALVLSETRNAWLGLLAGLTLTLALARPRAILYYVPAFYLFLLVAPIPLFARTLSIADPRQRSNYDRLCMIQSGVGMMRDNPLFGVGLAQVKKRYVLYRVPGAPRFRVPHLHNNLAQIAAERGLLAFAAYIALIVGFFVGVARRMRQARQHAAPIYRILAGAMAAFTGITIAGFFEFYFGDSEILALTLMIATLPFCMDDELRAAVPAFQESDA